MQSIILMTPGCHLSMAGIRFCFTARELLRIAETYDPAIHQAPLVLGHPANDASAPSHGWVRRLAINSSGALVAFVENVTAELKALVKDGRYRHVSASFYPPGNPSSPSPGGFSLRHVGILGAAIPAVKGLGQLVFADGCVINSACCVPLSDTAVRYGAEFDRSLALQAEFSDRQIYIAFANAAAAGRVRLC